jgi:hypothetical protein
MTEKPRTYSVVDWACEVLDMHDEIISLRRDVKHLHDINALLNESVNASSKHADRMMGGMLLAAMGANEEAREFLTENYDEPGGAEDAGHAIA